MSSLCECEKATHRKVYFRINSIDNGIQNKEEY